MSRQHAAEQPPVNATIGLVSADELDDEADLIMNAFFTQSEPSKAAGRAIY
jgi:hypothetical protein